MTNQQTDLRGASLSDVMAVRAFRLGLKASPSWFVVQWIRTAHTSHSADTSGRYSSPGLKTGISTASDLPGKEAFLVADLLGPPCTAPPAAAPNIATDSCVTQVIQTSLW